MDSSNTIITDGIVLAEYKYGENSKFINILTPKLGKINVSVNNNKKTSTLATQKMSKSRLKLKLNNNKFFITDISLLESYLSVTNEPKKFIIINIILEILNKTLLENYKDFRIYYLLDSFLKNIQTSNNLIPLKSAFVIKYLSFLGYRPGFNVRNKYSKIIFSVTEGVFINKSDFERKNYFIDINPEEYSYVKKLLFSKFSEIKNIVVSNISASNIDNLLMKFLLFNTDINQIEQQKIYDNLFK